MIMFKRACKRGQSENATLSEILKRAWKIERGVTLKIILEKNSNPYLEQIESHQSYLGGSIIRVLVQVIVTEKQSSRVLSRIYLLGEKSWVAEGDELPRGHSPRKCFEINMRWDAIWCILRNVTVCALTSSRLDDFSDIVTYTGWPRSSFPCFTSLYFSTIGLGKQII